MSAEADLRAALVASAGLLALVPAAAICLDAVPALLARPYIAIVKQSDIPTFGLNNSVLGRVATLDVQCIGSDRKSAIAVREAVETAMLAAGWPWLAVSAGYDSENDLEVEVVTVNWMS